MVHRSRSQSSCLILRFSPPCLPYRGLTISGSHHCVSSILEHFVLQHPFLPQHRSTCCSRRSRCVLHQVWRVTTIRCWCSRFASCFACLSLGCRMIGCWTCSSRSWIFGRSTKSEFFFHLISWWPCFFQERQCTFLRPSWTQCRMGYQPWSRNLHSHHPSWSLQACLWHRRYPIVGSIRYVSSTFGCFDSHCLLLLRHPLPFRSSRYRYGYHHIWTITTILSW